MIKLIIILSILIFPGNCLTVLSQETLYPCVTFYSDRLEPVEEICHTELTDSGICDYHYKLSKLYCVNGNFDGYRLVRLDLLKRGIMNSTNISYTSNTELRDFAVDWIHETFYVIYENLMVAPLKKTQQSIQLREVVSQQNIASLCKQPSATKRRVHVDPFKRYLFVLVSFDADETGIHEYMYILRSNLEENNFEYTVLARFEYEKVNFGIDVGEMKLHLTYEESLYTYNYEGTFLNRYKTMSNVIGISAFGNQVYLHFHNNLEESLNFTTSIPEQISSKFEIFSLQLQPNSGVKRLKIIDARMQREKRNGNFVCLRKDCPDLCEVHDLGDLCIREDINTKKKNQLMCNGDSCPDILVYGGNMACILHYTDEDTVERCLIVNNSNGTLVDYHMTDGFFYYIDNYYDTNQLKRMALNFTVSENFIKTFRYKFFEKHMYGIAIDWIRNTIYTVVGDNLDFAKGDIFEHHHYINLRPQKGPGQGKYTVMQMDPYEQILFLRIVVPINEFQEAVNMTYYNIITEDYRLIRQTNISLDASLHADIGEKKIYILEHRKIYIYNYEAILQETIILPKPATKFVVFMNLIYITAIGDKGITKIPLNETNLPLESYQVQYHGMNENLPLNIKLLDARIQRRMENGTYVCDKRDCPYLCEVRSSGDICVCPKDKVKRKDGITCYECGQSNLTSLTLQPTIVNGIASGLRDFPWHAVLYTLNVSNLWDAACGGSLVSSRAVLTAAHCVMTVCLNCQPSVLKTEQLRVALGKIQRSWYIYEPQGQQFEVAEIRVSKEYKGSSASYANDIALILLDSTVSFNEYVKPACLDYSLNQLPPHETLDGYVPGFGNTEDCVGICTSFSETLQYTKAKVMSYTTCFEVSNAIDPSTFHRLTSDKFCIGNGSESAVQKGDSGGGLTLEYHGLHYVTGIVSVKLMKIDGDTFRYSFGAFTNVSKHIDWIKENMPEDE